MSLAWQKQLLFKDYSKVGGQERQKGKYTDGLIGNSGKKEAGKEESNLSCVCLQTSESDDRGCWEISVGNSLMASIWRSRAVQCYHSPHLSFSLLPSAHKTERRGEPSLSMLIAPERLLIKSLYCL